jgi:cytosine/adenosine deaminase-related metal-dependent hydrolase
LFTPEGLTKGCLRLEEGLLVEVCYGDPPSDSSKSIVLPCFVNAHTHIGDSFAFPAPKGSVEDLVGPPGGYKHRMLRTVSREAKLSAMTDAVEVMSATGTSTFIDFREEGLAGVMDLLSAVRSDMPRPTVLGRPTGVPPTDNELE